MQEEANLHDGIELGTISARDPDVTKRIKDRRIEIDGFNQRIATLKQQTQRGPVQITPEALTRFGKMMRERLIYGDGPARQNIARAFISRNTSLAKNYHCQRCH